MKIVRLGALVLLSGLLLGAVSSNAEVCIQSKTTIKNKKVTTTADNTSTIFKILLEKKLSTPSLNKKKHKQINIMVIMMVTIMVIILSLGT